jgi:hypothetical protein
MIEPAMIDRPGIEFPGQSFSMQVSETRLSALQPAAEDDTVFEGAIDYRSYAVAVGR